MEQKDELPKIITKVNAETFNESVFKDYLVKCFSLLEDLKKSSDSDVKKFIFDKLYNNLGIVEARVYKVFQDNTILNNTVKAKENEISKLKSIHAFQMTTLNNQRIEELNQIVESHADNEMDKDMDEKLRKNKTKIMQENQIPDEEVKAYTDYLNGNSDLDYLSSNNAYNEDDEEPLTMEEILYGNVPSTSQMCKKSIPESIVKSKKKTAKLKNSLNVDTTGNKISSKSKNKKAKPKK